MAVGKNKKLSKGKKGQKKKPVDSFLKKEWYDIKVPVVFKNRNAGKTVVNKTQGTHIASDSLKGRVFELNQGDLSDKDSMGFNKFKFICQDVQGKACITNFYGLSVTRDKIWALVKKGRSTIEAWVDVKTKDGYVVRVFMMCFVAAERNQIKKTCYAKQTQKKTIRKIMRDVIESQFATGTIRKVMERLQDQESIANTVYSLCASIKKVKEFTIRKVKIIKSPKVDLSRLHELHTEVAEAKEDGKPGESVGKTALEPKILQTV